VEQPELWWPNGFGEQRLYGAGNFEVGFRTVELHDYRLSVAEGEREVRAPLDAFAHDFFLLDVGGNRYVMTRTENLAPLLDLPRTVLELESGVLRNVGAVAAIGLVADDVIDLLPGEERAVSVDSAEGWNARV
jgi:hypothetical protein